MYYIVEKSGMFLAASTEWSSTWYISETNAQKFWSKDHAKAVAEKCEGSIQPRSMPN